MKKVNLCRICSGKLKLIYKFGKISLIGNFNKLNLIFFHQDQVVKLPQNAELIAGNSFCNISSFSIGDSVLALQAHPEFNKDFSLPLNFGKLFSVCFKF